MWSKDTVLCDFFLEMEACPRPLHHDDACSHLINNPQSIVIKVLQLANGAEKSIKENYRVTKTTDTVIRRVGSLDSYPVM